LHKFYEDNTLAALGQYERFEEYLDLAKAGEGKRFLKNKVMFAERICPFIDRESIASFLDLSDKLSVLCARIRQWNGIAE
jgi:hypothetical protein